MTSCRLSRSANRTQLGSHLSTFLLSSYSTASLSLSKVTGMCPALWCRILGFRKSSEFCTGHYVGRLDMKRFVIRLTAFSTRIFFVLYIFWKVFKRTHWRKSANVKLQAGKVGIDAAPMPVPEQAPGNIFKRVWFYIA